MATDIVALAAKFWSRVDKNGPIPERYPELGPCWIWTGGRTKDNYGMFYDKSIGLIYAHRMAWRLSSGDPLKLHVCHKCDRPPCCNPIHLFIGTNADNLRDMAEKGRSTRGERNPGSVLTEEQVLSIREKARNGVRQHILAIEYGVVDSCIANIVVGRRWKHLPINYNGKRSPQGKSRSDSQVVRTAPWTAEGSGGG